MENPIKTINRFFNESTKKEINEVLSNILLDEYQATVLKMRYFEHKDIGYIADIQGVSKSKLNNKIYLNIKYKI